MGRRGGESSAPEEGNENDWEREVSVVRGKAGEAGPVQLREVAAEREPHSSV